MKIYLLGAEQPTNLRLARQGGATHVGMSFHSLLPRLPKKPYDLAAKFDGLEVYLASGGHTFAAKSEEALTTFAQCHLTFVQAHAAALDLVSEVDDPRMPQNSRDAYVEALGAKFVPVWLPETGIRELERLAASYAVVGIRSGTFRSNPQAVSRLRPLSSRYGTQWHILDGARPDELQSARIHSAATTAWLSPMRNGETIVWDHNKMQRYPKRMADQARKRHRAQFIAAGYDADEILNGNYQETTRYTVSAFIELEHYLSRRTPDKPPTNPFSGVPNPQQPTIYAGNQEENDAEDPPADADNTSLVVRNESSALTTRPGGRKLLPVFGLEHQETTEIGPGGEPITTSRAFLRSSDQSLRQCDTCHVNSTCPAFEAGAECGLGIPVDLRTKDQIFGAAVAMIEMQMQRVAFMKYAEDLEGGYADQTLSQEMDRFMRMLEKLRDLQENKETLRFEIESRGQSGILSALIGEGARRTRELDTPVPSNHIIDVMVEE